MKRGKGFYLIEIYEGVKSGRGLVDIQRYFKISKQKINYYVKTLKELGYIERVGYSEWKIKKDWDDEEIRKIIEKPKKVKILKPEEEVKIIKFELDLFKKRLMKKIHTGFDSRIIKLTINQLKEDPN